ncbi:MAG: hypothetical protein ACKO96_42235, partial [Flammeovirgaceae bacterium]
LLIVFVLLLIVCGFLETDLLLLVTVCVLLDTVPVSELGTLEVDSSFYCKILLGSLVSSETRSEVLAF